MHTIEHRNPWSFLISLSILHTHAKNYIVIGTSKCIDNSKKSPYHTNIHTDSDIHSMIIINWEVSEHGKKKTTIKKTTKNMSEREMATGDCCNKLRWMVTAKWSEQKPTAIPIIPIPTTIIIIIRQRRTNNTRVIMWGNHTKAINISIIIHLFFMWRIVWCLDTTVAM